MSARIARGGPAGRARPRPRASSSRSVKTRRKVQGGAWEALGFPADFGRRLTLWLLGLGALALALALLVGFRVPQMAGTAIGEAIGDAGFTVRHVEVAGNRHVSTLDISNIIFHQGSAAMPLVDLADIRGQLLRYGWVKEARVSRRLPDTIVVDIIERVPAAIWQHEGQLSLVDVEGHVLAPAGGGVAADLPQVIGRTANRHLADLEALLATVPHLKPQVTGATWIGDRRWDVLFRTGETLSLPEGRDEARGAIARFARMDRDRQLLGHGFARFDMRIPGRVIVRLSREPGSRVPDLAPLNSAQPPADLSRTI